MKKRGDIFKLLIYKSVETGQTPSLKKQKIKKPVSLAGETGSC